MRTIKEQLWHSSVLLSVANWDAFDSLMTDDATFWIAGSTPLSGLRPKDKFIESGKANAKMLLGLFSSPMKIDVLTVTAEDDRVSVETRSNAKFKSGGHFRNESHFLFKLRNGKVTSGREYLDTLLLSEMLRGLQG